MCADSESSLTNSNTHLPGAGFTFAIEYD